MTSRQRGVWIRALLALVIGIAWPYLEIWWKCRAGFADSEACVWGKSFLSLGRWVEPLIVAPLLYLVFTLAAWLWRFTRGGSAPRA